MAADDAPGVRLAPADQLSAAGRLIRLGRFAEGEACARAAIAAHPGQPAAHNELGIALEHQGRYDAAREEFGTALRLDPGHRMARRNLAVLLARLGQRKESLPLVHAELAQPGGLGWLQHRISREMTQPDLFLAGELAWMAAVLRRLSDWYPADLDRSLRPLPVEEPPRRLTVAKLRHDVDQFEYLQRHGVLGSEITPVIAEYRSVMDRISAHGEYGFAPLDGENLAAIGHVFNRIMHIRETPRITGALSQTWDPSKVEDRYLDHPPGVVVIDNFLSAEALSEIRAFCLESTVWTGNRYGHGRLGAFFQEGFDCPLLLQIAEELRAAMPRVIGSRYTLRQTWGFKNSSFQPGDTTTHADFAAVNVNFWITPDEANADPSSGGMEIYGVDAPRHWDFHTYNGRSDIIKPFLARQKASSVVIPYRQNRAIVFNSDLFHGTSTVNFHPGYENRRINITMLYGVREQDDRLLARPDPLTEPGTGAWRSAAFNRARRPR